MRRAEEASRHRWKLFALVLAFFFWRVVLDERTLPRELEVPISFARLTPSLAIVGETPSKVRVKLSAYDFARYGGLEGEVSMVAPDSSTDENGAPYFHMMIKTDKSYLGEVEGDLPIMPGMQATVDVHTGTKSVMDYLIKPVLKLRDEAFRER